MPNCLVCGKEFTCIHHSSASSSSGSQVMVGSAVKRCPLKKGALWVQVLDVKGITGVGKVSITLMKGDKVVGTKDTSDELRGVPQFRDAHQSGSYQSRFAQPGTGQFRESA